MTCDKRFQKSSLSAITNVSQEIAEAGFVDFETNRILTGLSISHVAGSNTVELSNAGLYLVQFNADISSATAETVTLSLLNNSVAVPGAEATMTLSATDVTNISFGTLINVLPSCCVINNAANLQVNASAAVTMANANITVVKLA